MEKIDFEYKITNNDYAERFAKHMLAEVYNAKFKRAAQTDRPDIQSIDPSEGMEVTTLSDIYHNTLKRYRHTWSKKHLTLEQIVSSLPSVLRGNLTINKYGNVVFTKNNGRTNSVEKSQNDIISAVKIKLKKLQSYKKFSKNNLIIFATDLNIGCNSDIIAQTLDKIDKTPYPTVYDNILILTYDTLEIYPFKSKGKITIIGIDKQTRDLCDNKATQDMTQINKHAKNKPNNVQPELGL